MAHLVTREELRSWGARSRARQQGPEKALVDALLARLHNSDPTPYRLTIFEEPKIESGFPDLVLVYWDQGPTQNWQSSRADLTGDDLKVLHLLRAMPRSTPYELEQSVGPSVDESLSKLTEAGLIYRRNQFWFPYGLKETFAVKKIIAIEAKISDIATGIDQAALNMWFAHESMLLVPQSIRTTELQRRASQYNIQVLTPDSCSIIRPKVKRSHPISYVSWLFNEWVWRAHQGQDC